jgi:hypothetical protein
METCPGISEFRVIIPEPENDPFTRAVVMPVDLQALLGPQWKRLYAICVYQASNRNGLEADDLFQDTIRRFIEAAPRWFKQAPRAAVEAQASTLLRYSLLQALTGWDRERRKFPPALSQTDAEGNEVNILDTIGGETGTPEDILIADETYLRLRCVDNPVYYMLLVTTHLPESTGEKDFIVASEHTAGGARTFIRPVDQAWSLFVHYRQSPYRKESEWKRLLAELIRCPGRLGENDAETLEKAQGWFTRNLHRAHSALAEVILEGA